jgi:ABC-type multidrug transport system fused ATPase/permease subunit
MFEEEKMRKATANWREYLKETRQSVGNLAWVWRELLSDSSRFWARRMLVLAVVTTALGLLTPWLVRGLIDGLVKRQGAAVVWALVGLLACWLVGQVLEWLTTVCREYVFGENVKHIDHRTAEMFFEKSLGQHLRDNSVLSVGNMEKGRGRIYGLTEMLLWNGQTAVLTLILSYAFLWALFPVAALVMTAVLANYVVWMIYLNRRTVVTCTPIDLEWRRLNRYRCERWDKIERVKTSGKEGEEAAYMRDWSERTMKDDRRFWLWFIRVINYRSFFEFAARAGIVAFGVWQVWRGNWTVGLFYPLITWTGQFMESLWRVGHVERQLNFALPSVQSLRDALTMPPDITDTPDAVALPDGSTPKVTFENVGYVYSPESVESDEDGPSAKTGSEAQHAILGHISFTVEPGERVALIGPSGIGKTTVMRLLQRYFDPTSGRVLVDGTDLREVKLGTWQKLVGYIAQQPQVLDGTIRSNLLYGLKPEDMSKVTDEDLWSLVKRLKIDFGDRLTEGLDTKVGRHGIKLSGGEQQRLMIGAAVMKRPRFWIIDEATSSLDSTTEKAVQEGLVAVMEEGTSALVIAHRLSTVRHLCSKFVVLSGNGEGSRVEAIAPSFEALHAASPTFRQLAADQDISI